MNKGTIGNQWFYNNTIVEVTNQSLVKMKLYMVSALSRKVLKGIVK